MTENSAVMTDDDKKKMLFWAIWFQIKGALGLDILRDEVIHRYGDRGYFDKIDSVAERRIDAVDDSVVGIGIVYQCEYWHGNAIARSYSADVYMWDMKIKKIVGFQTFPYVNVRHHKDSSKDLHYKTLFQLAGHDGKLGINFLDKKSEMTRSAPENFSLNIPRADAPSRFQR